MLNETSYRYSRRIGGGRRTTQLTFINIPVQYNIHEKYQKIIMLSVFFADVIFNVTIYAKGNAVE